MMWGMNGTAASSICRRPVRPDGIRPWHRRRGAFHHRGVPTGSHANPSGGELDGAGDAFSVDGPTRVALRGRDLRSEGGGDASDAAMGPGGEYSVPRGWCFSSEGTCGGEPWFKNVGRYAAIESSAPGRTPLLGAAGTRAFAQADSHGLGGVRRFAGGGSRKSRN
jgi:hypothetical protein